MDTVPAEVFRDIVPNDAVLALVCPSWDYLICRGGTGLSVRLTLGNPQTPTVHHHHYAPTDRMVRLTSRFD